MFGFLSSLMAVSSAVLCLVFALCWSSRTVHSYSNTRSLLMAGQTLYPTTLLLLTLVPTGELVDKVTLCFINPTVEVKLLSLNGSVY